MRYQAAALAIWGLIATGAVSAATISVNETTDELNNDGDCSLREAVQSANQNIQTDDCAAGSNVNTDLILLPGGTYTLSLTGTEQGDSSANDLDVTESLEIKPVSGEEVVIQPADAQSFGDRAFHLGPTLNSGVDVVMHDFTIRGFRTSGSGAAILAGRDLELVDMTFIDNVSEAGGSGGAVSFNNSNGTLRVDRSAFLENRSDKSDGGALKIRFNAEATVSNSTFVRNHAQGNGGAVAIELGAASLQNVTISDNSANGNGGGFYVSGSDTNTGTLALRNSILDGNRATVAGPDCDIASNGAMILTNDASAYNLVSDDTDCGIGNYTGTIEGQSAKLALAAKYDGVTPMRPPLSDSPAIDAGSCSTGGSSPVAVGNDQREASRISGDIGTTCDIGAVERNWTPYVVNSTADAGDANIDGICDDGSGNCTLRAAIDEANQNSVIGLESVVLPEGVFTLAIDSSNEDDNAGGDLDINRSLIITGAGADKTIIDADGIDRVLDIPNVGSFPRSVTLMYLALRNGRVPDELTGINGGGIRVSGSSQERNILRASGIRSTNNKTPNIAGDGAGISVEFSDARIVASTIDGNEAARSSSGINFTGGASGYLERVTISGNSAGNRGAIGAFGGSKVKIEHGTIVDNSAISGRQLTGNGEIHVFASIIAGSPGSNCYTGTGLVLADLGGNVEDGTDCGFTTGTQSANVDLDALADIGGPVPLREPNAGSDAVDGLASGPCTSSSGRLIARSPFGGTQPQDADSIGGTGTTGDGDYACDVGAAERQQVRMTQGPNAPSDQTVSVGTSDVILAQITATNESGEPIDRSSASLSLRATGTGDDSVDITAVRLYLDQNGDGQVDAGDVQRGATETFTEDDGLITFNFGEGPGSTPTDLPSGDSADYLVAVDFASQLSVASLAAIDSRIALAGGSGALAIFIGYCLILRRRPSRLVIVSTAALTLVACGGGGGGSGGGSGSGTGGDTGTSSTFAVTLEHATVTGSTSGRKIDLRTPALAGASITVQD